MSKTKTKTTKRKVLVTADTHFWSNAWLSRPSIRNDAYRAFESIVKIAIDEDVGTIIAAGDLIDQKRPTSETIDWLRGQLDVLEEHRISFAYTQGQHEISSPPWLSAVHGWPVGVHRSLFQPFHEQGPWFYGLDYTPAHELAEELKQIPAHADVLVCHQRWVQFLGFEGVCDGSLADVPTVSMIITGDHHEHLQRDCKAVGARQVRVLSPGATCMHAISEPSEHLCFILDEDLEAHSVRIPSRPVVRFNPLNGTDSVDAFIQELDDELNLIGAQSEGLHEDIRMPIVQASYSEEVSDAYRKITNACQGRCHLFLTSFRPELPEVVIRRKERSKALEHGLLGCLGLLEKDTSSQLYKDAKRLLEAEDIDFELQKMRLEAGLP